MPQFVLCGTSRPKSRQTAILLILEAGNGQALDESILTIVLFAATAAICGAVVGYLFAALAGRRQLKELASRSQRLINELTQQRDRAAERYTKARETLQVLKTEFARGRSEVEAANAKAALLARNVQLLRAERESTKAKVSTLQNSLTSVQKRTNALQSEFEKAGAFYKRELRKSFEKRKDLENDIVEARADQVAFAKRIEESSLEHGSQEEMVIAAQLRLGQIDVLERNIAKLEAENGVLVDAKKKIQQDFDDLQQELEEMEQLKINNQQLVRCVESLEKRRAHHEEEAEQYRDQADQSEQLSETLRLKLNDLENSFAAMEEQQQEAINHVRSAAASAAPASNQAGGGKVIKLVN